MPDGTGLAAFQAALDVRAGTGRSIAFWLRDDDAVADTPALGRLLELTAKYGVAPVIAAVPKKATSSLVPKLKGSGARVAVHGWAHSNHAPTGAKKAEFGPDRPVEVMLQELTRARERIEALAGPLALPLLVPPWNRIAPALVPQLDTAGFVALSAFTSRPRESPSSWLRRVDTRLDIIDWRGTRGGRPAAILFTELARIVEHAGDEPIGILAHHLAHDETAWQFLEALFGVSTVQRGVRWLLGEDLTSDDEE